MPRLEAHDIMSRPVLTVRPETSIVEAARIMSANSISGLPVLDGGGALVGIVTEGDLLVREAGFGGIGLLQLYTTAEESADEHLRRFSGRTVADVMTSHVTTAGEYTTVREIAGLLTRVRINRVPIMRDGRLIGIVTRQDILKVFARSDDELARIVRDHLALELRIDPAAVSVSARDGMVCIAGDVVRAEQIRLVELCVHGIDGVIGVDVSGLWARDPRGT